LPKYLKGIVDEATGEVDIMALDRLLSELRVSLIPSAFEVNLHGDTT